METIDLDKLDTEEIDLWVQRILESDPSNQIALRNAAADRMFDQTKKLVGTIVEYKELMMYTCAMKEIRTKFEVLNTEFNVRYQRNPIKSISTRLKKTSSIIERRMVPPRFSVPA